ncbi:hypothetical protein PhCBS80983_g04735 [Powellomyces hirtus]|uniref:Carrier domain-containing protein n=1 Tax=Powellomyces hirtus TaxID=109895 RepID=A0A507DYY3_9FUNG|nr:hypothetical protein PhCBS80983_g04735 [Powellomyces hirtus]
MPAISNAGNQTAYLNSFEGMPAPAAFPLPLPSPKVPKKGAQSILIELTARLAQNAKYFSRDHTCGLEAVIFSAWAIVHSRYLNSEDVTFGADMRDLALLTGTFCPRPLRVVLSARDLKASALVRTVHADCALAKTEKGPSIKDIKAAAGVPRDEPLFRAAIGFWNRDDAAPHVSSDLPIILCIGQRSLTHVPTEILYDASVFTKEAMQALGGHFNQALSGLLENSYDSVVADINILTPKESHTILHDFNDSTPDIFEGYLAPRDQWCLQIPFEKKAKQHFEMNAVEHYDRTITYGQLNAQANRIAHQLRRNGVKPGDSVGLLVTRSIEMVVGVWAIIKSSAAYVAIDATFPPARVQYMLRDAGCVAMLTNVDDHVQVAACSPPDMKLSVLRVQDFSNRPDKEGLENPSLLNNSDHALYLVYTSGTTGKPKGVEVPHKTIYNLVLHGDGGLRNTDGTRMMQFSAIGFDLLAWEIFATHCRGGTLVVRPDELGEELEQALYRIDTLLITPSALSVVSPDQYPNIKKICVSGEPNNAGIVSRWGNQVLLMNGYGPAETHASHVGINIPGKPITVGRIIPGNTCYILDHKMRHVPIGVPGLVYSGGVGVGNGYRNLPELNAEKFTTDPFANDGSKMYCTGDLGRWTLNGELEVIGRADHQVKINGFRVELGEVETVLGRLPGVSNVCVLHESKQLVGFISPHTLNGDVLRTEMKKVLPYYMVPSKIMTLEMLPMTENRKVDRRKLATLIQTKSTTATVSQDSASKLANLPSSSSEQLSSVEAKIASVWAEVLKFPVESITPETSFLTIGGDSIGAILVSARLRRAHGMYLSPTVIFDNPILRELASTPQLSKRKPPAKPVIGTSPVQGVVELTPIQHWFLEWEPVNPDHYNQTFLLIPNKKLVLDKISETMTALVAHHDMLRARFILNQEEGTMQQRILGPHEHPSIIASSHAAANESEMMTTIRAVQRSLRLEDGPIIAAGLIQLADGQQRLVITVHHLVMDLVSWRILLEDFQTLYTGAEPLPPKTTSFQQWALKQSEYARTLSSNVWPNAIQTRPPIASDYLGTATHLHRAHTMRRVTVTVPVETVRKIFSDAVPRYQCTVLELLVAALALAYGQQFDRDVLAVDLEGHGREPWDEELDVSRTLGWFTTTFPVALPALSNKAMGGDSALVSKVKATIRGLPLKGLPYGALRYLTNNPASKAFVASHPTSEIIYNYYGAFNQLEDKSGLLQLATDEYPNGEDDYEKNEMLRYRFSIETLQHHGVLETRFLYSSKDFNEATVKAFATKFANALEILADPTCDPVQPNVVEQVTAASSIHHAPEFSHSTISEPSTAVVRSNSSEYTQEVCPFELLEMNAAERQSFLSNILEEHPVIDLNDIQDAMPCSPLQEGIVVAVMLEKSRYTWQTVYKIPGDVDASRLEAAWRSVVQGNDMIRTVICWAEGFHSSIRALQLVLKSDRTEWKNIDCGSQEIEAIVKQYLEEDELCGFTLGSPLVRSALVLKAGEPSRFILTVNHALTDQWSLDMVVEGMREQYHQRTLEPFAPFSEFLKYMLAEDWTEAKEFWADLLRGVKPTEFPRLPPNVACRAVNEFNASYPLELGQFSRANGISASVLVYGAWSIVLGARASTKDVVFGTTFSGRSAPLDGIERICGPCLNMLPFRVSIVPGTTIMDFLKTLQKRNSGMMEYESTPKSVVYEAAGVDSHKLYDTFIAMQNVAIMDSGNNDASLHLEVERTTMSGDTPIQIEVSVAPGGIDVMFRYDEKITSREQIVLLSHHLADALAHMMEFPQDPVECVPLLSAYESNILHSWGQGRAAPIRGVFLHQLVQQQAARTPEKTAMEFYRGGKLTYRNLMENVNRLGRYLQTAGVRSGAMVPVCMARSLDMPIVLLAIMAAGGAYVPISEKATVERVRDILKATNATTIVTSKSLAHLFDSKATGSKAKCVVLDELTSELAKSTPASLFTPNLPASALAFVLFTSGSTGEPKGVMVQHSNVVNSLKAHTLWNIGEHSRVLNVSPYTFDLSVTDIFLPLISGGTVVLASDDDIQSDLARVIRDTRVDHIEMVPSLAETVDPASVPNLKSLATAGEPLTEALVHRWASKVRLINNYGPTETTIHSHSKVVEENANPMNVGFAIGDVGTYILKDDLSMVPITIVGEIYIDGMQVCRGYLNGTVNENKAFVPHPFKEGGRLYRTGDLGRFQPDGTLEIAGRIGMQVKINGLRIDLEAIDSVILRENVVEAVVTQSVESRGKPLLVAFIVVGQKSRSVKAAVEALEKAIAAKLPPYMIPRHWIPVDEIPLTANFKLDRRALQASFSSVDLTSLASLTRGAETSKEAPVSELEKELHSMWTSLLGLAPSDVGTNDSFFNLGGESLTLIKFVNKARAMGLAITASDVFATPSIKDLAKLLDKERPVQAVSVPGLLSKPQAFVAPFSMLTLPQLMEITSKDLAPLNINLQDIEDIYPSTPMQQSLVAATLTGEGASYLSQVVYDFETEPNVDKFKTAWRVVIRANPILRTLFVVPQSSSSGLPCVQVVMRDDVSSWTVQDVANEEELEKFMAADLEQGVKLGSSFMRFALLRTPASTKFIWTVHHALYDGWSWPMVFDDLETASRGETISPRPAFKHFVQHLVHQDKGKAAEFWKEQLKDFTGMTFPRVPSPSHQVKSAGTFTCALDVDLAKHAKDLSVTISTILRATWALVLAAHANSQDVSFACVSSGRSVPVDDIDDINGPCITCVPVRVVLDKSMTVMELLRSLQKQHLEMMEYEHCSLMDVLSYAPNVSSMNGLFTSMLVVQNQPEEAKNYIASGLKLSKVEMGMDTGLCLEVRRVDARWEIVVDYDEDIITKGELKWMIDHVCHGVKELVHHPNAAIGDVELMSSKEREFQISQWGREIVQVDEHLCVHQLVEQQVARTPESIAVEFLNGATLTYAELNRRSNRLAVHLRSIGVGPEVVVPICVGRCVEMVVAVLGVLKAGGAYVPLDPDVPAQRINFIIKQTKTTHVLTTANLVSTLQTTLNAEVLSIEQCLRAPDSNVDNFKVPSLSPRNLAYIIYTSGSTGEPKGAMIPHRAIVSASGGFCERYSHSASDRRLNYATFTFDDCVMDFFATLRTGGTICMASKEELATDLAGVMSQMRVTFLATTPSVLAVLDPQRVPTMRAADIGGEPMMQELVQSWGGVIHLGNGYGPTETCCLSHSHRHYSDETNIHLIGYPYREVSQYLLDDDLKPVPVGCVGEICLAGPQLGRGYLGRPDLTSKAWVDHPQLGMIYRSGDLGRYWHDGQLVILGRSDDQVKLHGLRIELGEIENVLLRHQEVKYLAAVVMTLAGENDKSLVCFYDLHRYREKHEESTFLPADVFAQSITVALTALARSALPYYMVPSMWVPMTRLPFNKNGKIDKKALKQLEVTRATRSSSEFKQPSNASEQEIFDVVKKLLGNSNFGIDDSWWTIGLNSLSMIRFIGMLRSIFPASNLKNSDLNTNFSVQRLAAYLNQKNGRELDVNNTENAKPSESLEERSVLADVNHGRFPASFAQERMWLAQEMRKDSTYHIPELKRIRQPLRTEILIRAMRLVCERNAILRTTFDFDGQDLLQVVHAKFEHDFEFIDLTAESDPLASCQQWCAADNRKPFNIADRPPLRFAVFKLGHTDHVVYINLHHIIADEWTFGLLLDELSQTYWGLVSGSGNDGLKPRSLEYVDFTLWQRRQVAAIEDEQLAFWTETFRDIIPANIPSLMTGKHDVRLAADTEEFILDPAAAEAFLKVCKLGNASPYIGWLSLFQVLVFRYSHTTDFAFLSPVTNRSNAAAYADVMGCFLNTVAVTTRLDADLRFVDYLRHNAQVVNEQLTHVDLPFERIISKVFGKEARQKLAELQVMFAYVTEEKSGADKQDIFQNVENVPIQMQQSGYYDLGFFLVDDREKNQFVIRMEYNAHLYDPTHLRALAGHFQELLRSVTKMPLVPMGSLKMLTEEEENSLVNKNQDTPKTVGDTVTVHGLFEKQCLKTPNAIALEHLDGRTLTYAELDAKANQVAHLLHKRKIPSESAIVLCLDKCFDAVWWMLGAMKAGCCWVPIDPAGVAEKNDIVIRATKAPFVVTTQKYSPRLRRSGHDVVEVEVGQPIGKMPISALEGRRVTSDSLSWELFTSGSTGTPKGVMIEHRAGVNFVDICAEDLGMNEHTRVLNFSIYTFDLSIMDIFCTLSRGGTVCVAPAEQMQANLAAVVQKLAVNSLTLTPTVISLLSPAEVPSLKTLCSAGEPITQKIVETWFPRLELLANAYGPTETAVTTISFPNPSMSPTMIGKPAGSTLCYVVDDRMNLVPTGVSGQLAVGGGHVARGYLDREDLTKEKFIDNPFVPGSRMYLTGDRVRFHANGQLECFGRMDNQVKINGRRTELGEIEHAMSEVPSVRNACVILHNEGKPTLIGYVTFENVSGPVGRITDGSQDRNLERIRALLMKKLPSYMVPRKLIALLEFPRSTAGKIDRGKVRAMRFFKDQPTSERQEALGSHCLSSQREGSDLEAKVLRIVSDILMSDEIKVEDDLLAHGLESYAIMRVLARVRKDLETDLTIAELSANSSVRLLAMRIGSKHSSSGAIHAHMEPNSASHPFALETELLRAVRELLESDEINEDDDLLDHGLESYAIMRLLSKLRKDYGTELTIPELSTNSSVKTLAVLISSKQQPTFSPANEEVDVLVEEKEYPASYTQERMWTAQITHGDNAYHLAKLTILPSVLDAEVLIKAVEAVCHRHTILRTTYNLSADFSETLQVVRKDLPLNFKVVDLSGHMNAVEEMRSQCQRDDETLFDLSRDAPIRLIVFKMGTSTGVYLNIHHIAVDEWALNLLLDEITIMYEALSTGRPALLEPAVQFVPIAVMHRQLLEANHRQIWNAQARFWATYLKGLPTLRLSQVEALSDQRKGLGIWSKEVSLNPSATKRFLDLASTAAVSPFTAYFALFQALIAKHANQYDFGVVTPVSLRSHVSDSFTAIGCFINTVLIRPQFSNSDSVIDVLKKTKVNINTVLENTDIPFEDVIQSNQLFASALELMFDYNTSTGSAADDNIFAGGKELELGVATAHFPFTFSLDARRSPYESTIMSIQYDSELFDAPFINNMMRDYAMLLEAAVSNPAAPIASLSLDHGEDLSFRGASAAVPYDCIHEGFEAAVALHSDRVALEHGDRVITYKELDMKANAVAAQLRAYGVEPGTYVAIVVHRSVEMAVSLLATLKAGGVCVPISADFPADRIDYILRTVSAKIILTTGDARGSVPPGATVPSHLIEELISQGQGLGKPKNLSDGGTIAYCIFTSGTTGTPKGVMVPHKGIVNNVLQHPFTSHCKPGVRVGQMLGISFDGALQEFYGTWLSGATLVLREADIFKTLRNVECINFTPTGIMQMEPSEFPNLKVILAIGEACPDSIVRKWGDHVTFYVDYGATETSVTTSCTLPLKPGMHISIGEPFANNSYYVLDDELHHVGIGEKGQVHVGGIGVALGYIGNPELTARKFLPDPFSKTGGRMYATGDMVRRLSNGELEFAGRVDDQVKLGGYRVELNEVTSALLRGTGVDLAAAFVEDSVLVAFVSPSTVDLVSLKTSIQMFLPPYMIPGKFVAIDEFPRTFNGKADVKRLREELRIQQQTQTSSAIVEKSLSDPRQQKLAQIWASVLKIDIDRIQPDTSFLELGGNSMNAVRMILAASQTGIKLGITDVYQKPTLAELAFDPRAPLTAKSSQKPAPALPSEVAKEASLLASDYASPLKPRPSEVLPKAPQMTKKLRIMCLHGSETSGTILSLQLQALRQNLRKEVEFYFLNGPRKQYTSYVSKYFDGPYYRWLPSSSSDVGQNSTMTAVNHLLNEMDAFDEPFDGILGFSEGASIVEMADRLSATGRIPRKWNFSVLISACAIKASSPSTPSWIKRPFEGGYLRFPSVHVISSQDYLFRRSMEVERRYEPESRQVVTHDSGHQIPQTPGFVKQLAARILSAAAMVDNLDAFDSAEYKMNEMNECGTRHEAQRGWFGKVVNRFKGNVALEVF